MESERLNRKRAYSQRVLRETLLEMLKTTPLHKITVTQLCERADVNRTTFYANYQDLYDLFGSIAIELHETIRNVLLQYENLEGKVYYKVLLETIRENADVCRAALRISQQEYQELHIDFAYGNIMATRAWQTSLDGNLMEYLLAGTRAIINHWLESDMSTPAEVLADHLYTLNNRLLEVENLSF